MELKIKGLNIEIDKNKNIGFLLTKDAVKEFCEYHHILYEKIQEGVVTTRKAYYHGKMVFELWELITNNNWRKMHHLPLIRRGKKNE